MAVKVRFDAAAANDRWPHWFYVTLSFDMGAAGYGVCACDLEFLLKPPRLYFSPGFQFLELVPIRDTGAEMFSLWKAKDHTTIRTAPRRMRAFGDVFVELRA